MLLIFYTYLIFYTVLIHLADGGQIKIGGLFDSEDDRQQSAFEYAVEAVNRERILPRHELVAKSINIAKGDSFAVSQAVCALLKNGVVGIFGPSTGSTAYHVQSVCDTMEVPHVEARMDPDQKRGSCLINLFPYPPSYATVFVKLVEALDWAKFTILYENSDSFPRISELLKMYDPKGYTITVKQLDLGLGNNYRSILHHVKKSGDTNFIIDCSIEILYDVLIQAQQIGIMSDEHNYIITNPDMHTIDMEPFQYGGANITGVRLVDPEDPNVIELTQFWNSMDKMRGKEEELVPEKITSNVALMFDAVLVFANGLKELNISRYEERSFDCNDASSWEHGFTMINYMKTNNVEGLTRGIKFDRPGFRSDFLLDIVELSSSGIEKVATWNSTEPQNITRVNIKPAIDSSELSLLNRTFLVLTAISDPYGMMKESSTTLEGNDRYEGFGIELIHELSLMLGFNYTFEIQEDGIYGSLDKKTGQWNGMIRKLLDNKADLAITDLTITSDRETAVDFTMPFMNLGISILYKKPTKEAPSLFSFMAPFSTGVWMLVGTAYLSVSVLVFIMARFAPEEWQNPYPCVEEPDQLENQFSMPNSLWFVIGAVLQQGSELAPIAISTRMIAGVWWFFTLIMVSSYTANLAAFLTVEPLFYPITSAEDLASNPHGITYGAKRQGSTLDFFKEADSDTYQTMYNYMEQHKDQVLLGSNDAGVKKVKDENYAYLMESTSIEYIVERNCDLAQVGKPLDEKGYGIAMRKNSEYRNTLSAAVLRLQEQGKLHAMKNKWWKEKRGGGSCSGVDDEGGGPLGLGLENVGGVFVVLVGGCISAFIVVIIQFTGEVWDVSKKEKATAKSGDGPDKLGLDNVGGVFVVLMGGGFAGVFFAILDLFYGVANRAAKHKVSFKEELWEELKFVITTSGNTKPVRHKKSPGSSRSESGSAKSGEEGELEKSLDEKPPATNGKI